jgi:hypothetical protein
MAKNDEKLKEIIDLLKKIIKKIK